MDALRLIPGCCTVATDSPTVGTTATATITLPMLTSEAAATTSADLSLALEDKREGSYQRKIKIDSWNHVLISCFTFVQRVCQNIEIERRKLMSSLFVECALLVPNDFTVPKWIWSSRKKWGWGLINTDLRKKQNNYRLTFDKVVFMYILTIVWVRHTSLETPT